MDLFATWCTLKETVDKRKRLWVLSEKSGGRKIIHKELIQTIRSHYSNLELIAEDIERLGCGQASKILEAILPQRNTAQSGDIGEILASELVEEKTDFSIPIKRLRYKDGRDMALRGDDFIGTSKDINGNIRLLKGESKSNIKLGKTTIKKARQALNQNGGRCTPSSLLFVANELLKSDRTEDKALGRAIRDEVGLSSLKPSRIDHMLFTFSGNGAPPALKDDLLAASANRNQYSVNLHVPDHSDFIKETYEKVRKLGNS